jgi:uncharacterized membrane protein
MTYNLHPLVVHFPIALLVVYAGIKIVPVQKWFPSVSWNHIERALLFIGVLGAFAGLLTGETAEHLFQPNRELVEMHAFFATLSTWVFGTLLVGEILSMAHSYINATLHAVKIKWFIFGLESLLTDRVFSVVLACVGLIAISVTGLLGGVMVYGLSADPLAETVVNLLGITL